jgi:uncharacterized protein YaaQ
LIAVIQAADCNLLEKALDEAKLDYDHLPSVGGFLREHNITFLIGCSDENYYTVKNLLVSICKKRISFVATPLESPTMTIPFIAETIVGGVNYFSLDLDHFEEI